MAKYNRLKPQDVVIETVAIAKLEAANMTKKRQHVYIALESLDFTWDEKEIHKIKKMWVENIHLTDMAQSIDRDIDEVFILLLDLARRSHLPKRPGGVYGCFLSSHS